MEKSKEEIKKINPYKDDWGSGDFPYMTTEQLYKVLHYLLESLRKSIIELKKKLGLKPFLDDVVRQQIINALLTELQIRFFDKEVIPVKK